MTRIYYDTEFVDTGREILPISIGMVKEDGEELYLVNDDPVVIETAVKDEWLRENVVPYLPVLVSGDQIFWDNNHPDFPAVGHRERLMKEVRRFVLTTPKPELWAWYGSYDHVFIAQLFGRMHDLPEGFPMCTFDLKQEHVRLGSPKLPKQKDGQHNALADARHNVEIAQALKEWEFNPARFGPLAAILPVPVDAPDDPDGSRREPRAWPYTIGF